MIKRSLRIGFLVLGSLAASHAGETTFAPFRHAGLPGRSAPQAREGLPSRSAPQAREGWQRVTRAEVDRWFDMQRLPPDSGIVAPIASPKERPDALLQDDLAHLRKALPEWAPGTVADPVQRVRNLLYVAAVPDVLKIDPLERFVPRLVFERLRQEIPKDDLIKVLYWIARRPYQGDDSAAYALQPLLGIRDAPYDMEETRQRVTLYAAKFIGRLTEKIPEPTGVWK
jgi:hypothetical protein